MQDFRQQHLGDINSFFRPDDVIWPKIPKTDLRIFGASCFVISFKTAIWKKNKFQVAKIENLPTPRPPKKTSTFSNDWKTPYHQSKPLVFCQLICGFLCPKSPPLKHLMRWGRLHSHLFEMCIATANVTSKSRRAAKTDCGNWRKLGRTYEKTTVWMYKTLLIMGYLPYSINWLAGFLPSTVSSEEMSS